MPDESGFLLEGHLAHEKSRGQERRPARSLLSWRRWLPILGTAAILWFLLRQIQPHDVWRLLRGARWSWLAAGLGYYLLTNVLRAYRFGALLSWRGRFAPLRLVPDMIALSFLNNLLPARSGELSFPYLLQRRHGVPVGRGLLSLLIARIFDLLAVSTLFVVVAFLERGRTDAVAGSVMIGVGLLLLLVLCMLLALPWLGRHGLRVAEQALRPMGLDGSTWQERLLHQGQRAVAAMTHLQRTGAYGRVFFYSLLGWLTTFAWFAAFLQAVGLPIRYPQVIAGATFATLTKAIPFITVGGLGAHEAGWTVGFQLVGMPLETAIASGLAVNLLTLLLSGILGALALAIMRRQRQAHDQRPIVS